MGSRRCASVAGRASRPSSSARPDTGPRGRGSSGSPGPARQGLNPDVAELHVEDEVRLRRGVAVCLGLLPRADARECGAVGYGGAAGAGAVRRRPAVTAATARAAAVRRNLDMGKLLRLDTPASG